MLSMYKNLVLGMAGKFLQGVLHIFKCFLLLFIYLFSKVSHLTYKTRKKMFLETKSFIFATHKKLENSYW